ncbi:hypothetical protein CEUSTIGMA_g13737.t1 [Chlamydomonas eustigma]|uniref:Uncharacterized protein n=1 Tax=Chlamydomonas eustigma TaxID=1157962 RepID=A0A250XD83_9CHLO|nr:hypothetical protein CEUSTIGMA_g8482.t1 [Chlamydomonas eustigma]GAX86325.1 hypothetical protein CEUSTIGMA_g13737.t1 [Chlamydomonas eustigma]|eukprot:GAX81047.1 hypothetical protein CEUSTIGMA_g8482.t1 [Chlamydomonas eustigma]
MEAHPFSEVLVSGFVDNSHKLSPDCEEYRSPPASGKIYRQKSLLSEAISSCKSCPSLLRNLASQSSDVEGSVNYFQNEEEGDDDDGCVNNFIPDEFSKTSPTLKDIVSRPITISKTSREKADQMKRDILKRMLSAHEAAEMRRALTYIPGA